MGTALTQFVAATGAETPAAAMRRACDRLRQRVRAAGWTPGLDAYVRAFGLRVEEAPIPTAGRLDQEGGQYVVRVQRTGYRGGAVDQSGRPPHSQPPTSLSLPPSRLRIADATNRQRFTIAHEIGHALLLEGLKDQPEALAALRDPVAWAEIEALCDEAAGDLLVPLDALTALAGQLGVSLRGLEQLADRFRVAQEVIEARLLAAGALSLSLWRVSISPRTGEPYTQLQRILIEDPVHGGGRPGNILSLAPSSVVLPNIVLEAARHGRAHATRVTIKNACVHGSAAGIALCHHPLGTQVEQPSLLDPPAGEEKNATLGTDALATLLLFPVRAAEAGAPLWAALTSR